MKRVEQVETEYCDICESGTAGYLHCMGCGKAICFECRQTRAKEYPHAVFFSGSCDGLYCMECDARLAKNGDQLHAAYRQIERLRDENRGWAEDFKKRSDTAEERVKALQPKRS